LPDAQPLAGRLALVTGASRGIGHATALALAQAGAHVIATARTQGGLEALDDAILKLTGAHATLVPADITDGDGLDRLGGAIFERWGKLDILVSNAGDLGLITPVGHLDPEVWDRAVAVNMTSTAAATPHACWGPYAATKAGMEMLVKVYADEVEHTKLRCTLVNPGPMRTRMRMAAFPGEDPADLTPPEAIGPLMVELARGDLAPPGMVDYRLWAEGRPSLGDTRVS
jgi:NAD(P)-dependent dehydrogenase (short-subunit alcohol dehydrogenase family)